MIFIVIVYSTYCTKVKQNSELNFITLIFNCRSIKTNFVKNRH